MPLVKASNTLTNFSGTASFTPLFGALMADSFAGRYWIIVAGSILYELVKATCVRGLKLIIYCLSWRRLDSILHIVKSLMVQ
jgi:dipeptide/tripeptide permease